MKMIIIFTLVILIGLICAGCVESRSRSKWTKYKSLKELWPRLKNEKIEEAFLCDGDIETDVESWLVYGAIPKESLGAIERMFNDELEDRFGFVGERYSTSSCNQGILKIVTNKGKYAVPIERRPQSNWKEYSNLLGLWPHVQKEKIERISFCDEPLGVDIDSRASRDVPKEKLDECIRLIDKAVRDADRQFKWGPYWEGRMKIITDKGKYLVPAETEISNTASPKVYGNGWSSNELGEFLKKCGLNEQKRSE
jgi:hypothetical protein